MRNVHDDAPVLFRTRWAMSYLRGPLTLNEIKRLTTASPAGGAAATTPARPAPSARAAGARPVLQAGVTEKFLRAPADAANVTYQPCLGARVRARFVDAKAGMDAWESWYYLAPVGADGPDWAGAEVLPDPGPEFAEGATEGAQFADLPAAALSDRGYRKWSDALEDHVYRNAALNVMSCPALKMVAAPGGTEGDFRARIALALREKRDDAVDKLRKKYEAKIATLEDRARRAEQKVEREKAQAASETMSSALSVGGSLLGALFGGRRSSALGKVSTAARRAGRVSKERADVAHAEADAQALREQIDVLNDELATEIEALESELDPHAVRIETVPVRPRKADIAVTDLGVVWRP
jgi:hypothetical protein